MLIAAVGLDEHGHKQSARSASGRQGENAEVCTSLITELVGGLDTARPILAVLDGSKALASAVKQVWANAL